MTPWARDQPGARRLPTHFHASSGTRTRDPSVRAVENSTCLRPRGH